MNSNVTQLSVGRPAAHFPTAFSCVCFSLLGTWIILHLHRTYQHRVHSSLHTPAPTGPTSGHRVRLSALSLYVGSGNLLGMYICLVLSLHYNYSSVTATTCVGRSPADYPVNYIPSIAACIGDHFPQVSVWRSTVMVVEDCPGSGILAAPQQSSAAHVVSPLAGLWVPNDTAFSHL